LIRHFYVVRNRKRLGPYTENQLVDMVANDVLDAHDLAIQEGLSTFLPISSLVELDQPRPQGESETEQAGVDPSIDIRQIYVTHEGRRIGPFTLVQVQQLVKNKMLSPEDPAMYRGCLKSLPLASLLASVDRAVTRTQKLGALRKDTEKGARRATRRRLIYDTGKKLAPFHMIVLIVLAALASLTIAIAVLANTVGMPSLFGSRSLRVEVTDPAAMCLASALVKQFVEVQGYREPTTTISEKGVRVAQFTDGFMRRRIEVAMSEGDGSKTDNSLAADERHVMGFDAVVALVHPDNPIRILTTGQMAAILRGDITQWATIHPLYSGTISVHTRDTVSRAMVGLRNSLPSAQPLAEGVQRHSSDRAVDEAVHADPNAFGVVSYVQSTASKMVALSESKTVSVYPSSFGIRTEDYPLSRRLWLHIPTGWHERLGRGFARFVHTPAGHAAARSHGVVAPEIEIVYPSVPWAAPEGYRELVDGAGRLSTVIRFEHNTLRPDGKAHRDIADISEMLSEPEYRGLHLMLIGFWSPLHSNRVARRASRHAAKQAAKLFELHAITPSIVKGFGATRLLASENTREGQMRNRRVEVWVKEAL